MLPYHGWMSAPVAPVMVGQGPATEKDIEHRKNGLCCHMYHMYFLTSVQSGSPPDWLPLARLFLYMMLCFSCSIMMRMVTVILII